MSCNTYVPPEGTQTWVTTHMEDSGQQLLPGWRPGQEWEHKEDQSMGLIGN